MPFVTCMISLIPNTASWCGCKKAETETPSSNVSEARAKSTIVGTDLQVKVASSDPPYEALTQQIAYLMSAITNQNSSKNNECNGSKQSNGSGKSQQPSFRDQKGIEKTWCAGDVEVPAIVGESAPHPGKVITFLSSQLIQIKVKIMVKI